MKHLQEPVPPLRARRPDVPPELDAIVMRALAKDPSNRFGSAAEMDAALGATGLDRQSSTAPTVVTPRPVVEKTRAATEVVPRPAGQRPSTRTLAAITAFLLTAAVAALIVLYLQNRSTGSSLNGQAPSPTSVFGSQPGGSGSTAGSAKPTPTPARPPTPAGSSTTPNPCPLSLPGIHCNP